MAADLCLCFQLEDTGGEVCKDQLFNLDRLQVVDSGFNYVTQLWQRASCDTCFVLDSKKCPTTKLIPEVSNIWNASQVLEDCIKEHRNDSTEGLYDPEVCYTCGKAYENINEKYNLIKAITGDINFCMDVVDLINSTRSSWSRELGCCQDRKRPELVFLIMSAFIALAPVIFYGLAYVWPWRKQEGLLLARRNYNNTYLIRYSICGAQMFLL
ncbi:hypothetical protein AAG570_008489 [Ranatra chinensis]|uniref:Osteopetrosis-associated transmembrane protein 1 n=1 Tax=Ranatra chinensis TaxID=642074 RepID=A0ABD0YR28_9HEMI